MISKDTRVSSDSGFKDQKILLRPGLALIISDFHVSEPRRVVFEAHENVCELCFIVTGNIRSWIDGFKAPVQVRPHSTALWLTPRLDCHTDYYLSGAVRYVCVRIDRAMLMDIAGDFLNQAPETFNLILSNRQERLYYNAAAMTMPMLAAVQQIYQCPYHGTMAGVFLEAKALELVSHLLTYHFGDVSGNAGPLPAWERRRIGLARDILTERQENPPSLSQLAKMVGMNETKLKCGFRIVYGTSVFGYLRNSRLAKACMLLEAGHMSVTQVAYSVGYSSPSHFTRIFTKYYGVNPRDYLRGFRHPK